METDGADELYVMLVVADCCPACCESVTVCEPDPAAASHTRTVVLTATIGHAVEPIVSVAVDENPTPRIVIRCPFAAGAAGRTLLMLKGIWI